MFGKKPAVAASKVWKLDDDDDEMIDADDLLDEEDKQKPTSESLRVCSTTGKRKACKDCSCGLAEELDAEARGTAVDPNPTQKSSCGSVSSQLSSRFKIFNQINFSVISATPSGAQPVHISDCRPSNLERKFKSPTR